MGSAIGKSHERPGAERVQLPPLQAWTEAFELSPDAVLIVAGGEQPGPIRYVNSQAGRMFGYEPGELMGRSIEELVPAAIRSSHAHLRAGYAQAPTRRPMGAGLNLRGRRRDGGEFPVEISLNSVGAGVQLHVICAIRDVTERRQLEEALHQATLQLEQRAATSDASARQSQDHLRLFVEHAPAAVAMLDRDLRYVVVSNRWREDYGIVERDIVGLRHHDLFPGLPARWQEAHRRALAGELLSSEEDSFERADGQLEWLRWEVLPWHAPDGDVGGIMLFTEVITHRKQARETLLRSHEELEARVAERTHDFEKARNEATRANTMKSRFLAAASHDLRQPLQTIWSLQALLSRVHANGEYAPQCALLGEAVRTMDQLLSSLVDINRLEEGAIQPAIRDFALEEILPRLRSEFGYAASTKSLSLEVDGSAEFVRSDPMLLPVILRNLIGNAIKYTDAGGVKVRVRAAGTDVFIDIVDSGPGISPAHMARLFEAFYQVGNPLRDQRHGVGLGLSIVQTISRLLDHAVSIESQPGSGSTFTVRLPRGNAALRPAEPAPAAAMPRTSVRGKVTVMHIEDDAGVSQSMRMILRLEGYEVVNADSRVAALKCVLVDGVRPDLILCDYNLPMGDTGDEIIAELAVALGAKPPTIMLTGDIAERHVAKARLVAELILPKPVDVNIVLREIAGLLKPVH
jgi:PAS domain S-box-containing protein